MFPSVSDPSYQLRDAEPGVVKVLVGVPQCTTHPHVSPVETVQAASVAVTVKWLILKGIFFKVQTGKLFLSVHVGITYNKVLIVHASPWAGG